MFPISLSALPGRVRFGIVGAMWLFAAAGCSGNGAAAIEPAAAPDPHNAFIEVAAAGSAGRSWGSALPAQRVGGRVRLRLGGHQL